MEHIPAPSSFEQIMDSLKDQSLEARMARIWPAVDELPRGRVYCMPQAFDNFYEGFDP